MEILEHSPADIVAQLLVDLGVGTDPDDGLDWPIYATEEPDAPDNCITVYDTSGTGLFRLMTGTRNEYPGIQIRIRAARHKEGYAKAQEMAIVCDEDIYRNSVTLDESTYEVRNVNRNGNVLALGKESPSSNRKLWTINAAVTLIETSTGTALLTQLDLALLGQDGVALLI